MHTQSTPYQVQVRDGRGTPWRDFLSYADRDEAINDAASMAESSPDLEIRVTERRGRGVTPLWVACHVEATGERSYEHALRDRAPRDPNEAMASSQARSIAVPWRTRYLELRGQLRDAEARWMRHPSRVNAMILQALHASMSDTLNEATDLVEDFAEAA